MDGFAKQMNLLVEIVYGTTDKGNVTVDECIEDITHYTFYQAFLIPAVLITLSFGLTKQRRRLFLDVFRGRPGLVFPMDMMTRDTSTSYAAAFAATLHLIFSVIFEQKFAFVNYGPQGLKSLIAIGSMIVYGMVYFPIFACLAIGSTYGYAIGSIYIWLLTGLSTYQEFQCAKYYATKTIIILMFRYLPQFLCLIYLCFSVPGRFVRNVRNKKSIFETIQDEFKTETLDDIKQSYVGLHVQKLFIRPKPKPEPPSGIVNTMKAMFWKFWNRWVYTRDDGFEYSSRFQSVMFLGVLLLYMLGFEIFAQGIAIFSGTIFYVADMLGNQEIAADQEATSFLNVVIYVIDALRISFLISVTFTIVLNLLTILHMMSSYRKNLKDLHKGYHAHIPSADKRSNHNLLVGSIRYAGYQVAYIAWGFVIQAAIFFIISMIIAVLVLLFQGGYTEWLTDLLLYAWPIILSAVIINVLQILMARFIFLQEKGKHLAFDNRRMLFSFTYFLFFYNIFLGLVSCLLRIVKAIVLGALLLSRLDNSTLPHRFQFFDPGFAAYVGFMHVENAHNHPVVLVLVRIFLAERRSRTNGACLNIGRRICNMDEVNGKAGIYKKNQDSDRRRIAARFNWHVFYSLINNPELRLYRKGYIQALHKAKEEGLAIPVSDSLTTDPACIQVPKRNPALTHTQKTTVNHIRTERTTTPPRKYDEFDSAV